MGPLLRAAAAAAAAAAACLLCAGLLGDCGAAALRVVVEPPGPLGDGDGDGDGSELLRRAEALAVASASMALALLAGAFQGAHAAALRSPRGRWFRPGASTDPGSGSEDHLLQLALAPSPGGSEC